MRKGEARARVPGPSSEGRPGRDRTRLSLKFYPYTERGDGFTVVYAYSKN